MKFPRKSITILERVSNPDDPDWRRQPITLEGFRADLGMAVALFLGAVLSSVLYRTAQYYPDPASSQTSLLIMAVVTLPLAYRRRYPAAVAIIVSIAAMVEGHLMVPEVFVSNIALFMSFYSVGAWEPNRSRAFWSRMGIMSAWAVWLIISIYVRTTDPDVLEQLPDYSSGWSLSPLVAYILLQLLVNALYFSGAYWFGQKSWNSARDKDRLIFVARELEVQKLVSEEQAVALERLRIARELHDAVAHHLSLMGVQAGAARLSLPTNSPAVLPLTELEESARQAVSELHSILHTLREAGPFDDNYPGPVANLGIESIPELVDSYRKAGLLITVETIGKKIELPPLLSLNLYRIAQESLTNILKHAGAGTSTQIHLRYSKIQIEIEISNDKPARRFGRKSMGAGLGLIGMKERMESSGGAVEVGPLSRGGFLVRATAPLKSE